MLDNEWHAAEFPANLSPIHVHRHVGNNCEGVDKRRLFDTAGKQTAILSQTIRWTFLPMAVR